jgi:translocation and assembly module TamB
VAALGAASSMLLGKGQRPFTTTLANSVGLYDITLRERSSAVVSGTTSQVIAFGKRINERLTLVYEQGLTVANNALRIEYALTRTLTVRAEAGVVSSLGLYFRRTYD